MVNLISSINQGAVRPSPACLGFHDLIQQLQIKNCKGGQSICAFLQLRGELPPFCSEKQMESLKSSGLLPIKMRKKINNKQASPERFLKEAGFTIHHFNQNNIHTISQLVESKTETSEHNDLEKEETDKNIIDPEAQEPISLKCKVQNIIKTTMEESERRQSVKKILFSKEFFREKIQSFISSFTPKDQRMVDEKQTEMNLEAIQEALPSQLNQPEVSRAKKHKRQTNYIREKMKKMRELKKMRAQAKRKASTEGNQDQEYSLNHNKKKSKSKDRTEINPGNHPRTRSSFQNSQDNTIELHTEISLEKETTKQKIISKTTTVKVQKKSKKIKMDFRPEEQNELERTTVEKNQQKEMAVERSICKKVKVCSSEKVSKKKQKPSKESEEDYIFLKYKESLIGTLPSRNPQISHLHNSMPSQNVRFAEDLASNNLYFASQILRFKKHSLSVSCTNFHLNFIQQTLRSCKTCKDIPLQPENQLKKIKLKRNFQYKNKKILVLDLDETLVHSQALNEKPDKNIFPFSFEFDKLTRHYTIRNYAQQFIKNLAEKYYIVVFTSALQGYADNIIEHFDPEEKYIQHRLYRGNCYLYHSDYPYIKDLRILNRDLSQIVIVDNSLYAYWFNIDNGVPIAPFTGVQDEELVKLQQYLLKLQNVDDVRKVNRRAFHMHLFQQFQNSSTIMNEYCELMRKELGDDLTKQKVKRKIVIEQCSRVIIDLEN